VTRAREDCGLLIGLLFQFIEESGYVFFLPIFCQSLDTKIPLVPSLGRVRACPHLSLNRVRGPARAAVFCCEAADRAVEKHLI